MDARLLGRTGLQVTTLGFGCGNVGGLMVRGTPADRERAVARALELGINYFDTAPSYGDGLSERHLGQALKALRVSPLVGTKVRVPPGEFGDIRGAVGRSLEASLGRVGLERVDLLQLHNPIALERGRGTVALKDVLDDVASAMQGLQRQGKVRFWGITALGDTVALHHVLGSGKIDTAQVCYNLLNPSAGLEAPPGLAGQDFGRLLDGARGHRVGVIGIRALAAGALSGTVARHPVAAPAVDPIASGREYAADVAHAQRLQALVREGHAESLIEAALRFVVSHDAVSTVLVGYSSLEQLETAAAAVARGPLPAESLGRLQALWRQIA